ncbi:hypothetical protein RDABS01_033494 [Bienertia sinuspersici]
MLQKSTCKLELKVEQAAWNKFLMFMGIRYIF